MRICFLLREVRYSWTPALPGAFNFSFVENGFALNHHLGVEVEDVTVVNTVPPPLN